MRSSRATGLTQVPARQNIVVAAAPPKKSSWVLKVLVLVGLVGSVFILVALRHFISRDDFRLNFRGTKVPDERVAHGNPYGASTTDPNAEAQGASEFKKLAAVKAKAATTTPLVSSLYASKRPALYAVDIEYSGLYRADGEHESYAGAWLAPKRRLFESWEKINRTSNLEGSTMAVSGYGRHQDPRITLMSRDFFDFQVLHLSVTSNFISSIGRGGNNKPMSDRLLERVMLQMTNTVKELESDPGASMGPHGDERLLSRTVAIIPFTGFAASADKDEFQSNIRKLYFKSTFYSVYRYIRTIIVSVPSQNDYDVLRAMNLPIWKILNFKDRYNLKVNMEHPLSPVRLPKHTLLHVIKEMKGNPSFQRFEYAYYSEGDLVLHLRSEKELLDALDASGGTFAASPHRLQSNPLPKIYTPEMQALWDQSMPHKYHRKR